MKIRPLVFSVLVVMFVTTGCLFTPDESDDVDPPVEEYVFPDTANKLVGNFERYYEDRNLEMYRDVLSDDYRFIAQDQTEYNIDREMDIANKMFNELEGEGGIAFTEITVEQLVPLGTWEPTPANDPYFGGSEGSLKCPYDVSIKFKVANEDLWYVVNGLVVFYVTSREVEYEGAMRTKYELLGQHDQTEGGG